MLVGYADALLRLYGEIIIPETVRRELRHPRAPASVRAWAAALPTWLLVRPDPTGHRPTLPPTLDAGERAAIALALEIGAGLLLTDDRAAREAARARGLGAVGTIGIVDRAARGGFLDLSAVVAALRATNFRYPPALFDALLADDRARRGV